MATEVLDGLKRSEAARRIGVAAETIDMYARNGVLPYTMTPYGRVYRIEDLDQLRKEREAKRREKDG